MASNGTATPRGSLMAPLLEVRNVHKRYSDTVALEGVSFAVEAGEMFGLLGPNGAGKTTLLSIVSGLLAADAGGGRLDGPPLTPGPPDLAPHPPLLPPPLTHFTPPPAHP